MKANWLHFEIFTLENQGFYEQRSCKGLTARIIYQYKRRLYNVHWRSQMSLEKCCGGDSQFKKMIKTPKNNHQILPTQWLLIMKIYEAKVPFFVSWKVETKIMFKRNKWTGYTNTNLCDYIPNVVWKVEVISVKSLMLQPDGSLKRITETTSLK